jgi:hypothetical protein
MADNLVTKSEYKAYAALTTPNHDTEIDSLVPKVSAFVKTYCNTTFVDYLRNPKVDLFNGGTDSLILTEGPVQEILSVEGSIDYGQTYTNLVEFTDWVSDNYLILPVVSFPYRLKGYKVTYFAGYTTIPQDLKLAIFDLITYYRKNDGAVHSNKAPGTNSVQIEYISNTTLPAHIRRVLDLYKLDYV